MVTTIRLLDHVKRCSSYEDGAVIQRLIVQALRRGEMVELSFDGVLSPPSAFINAALITLLDDFDFEYIQKHLTFVQSTKQVNELIRSRFEFAMRAATPRPDSPK